MNDDSLPPQPLTLQRTDESSIRIEWSDGTSTVWTAEALRKCCPCAGCREKKREGAAAAEEPSQPPGLPVLSAAEAQPLQIEAMRPVGNYAYNIAFSDGHSSGIYQLDRLHRGPGFSDNG